MLLTVHIDDKLGARLADAIESEKLQAPSMKRQLTEAEFAKVFHATGGDPAKFAAEKRRLLGLPPLTGGRPREPVSRRTVVEAALRMYLDANHPSKKTEG